MTITSAEAIAQLDADIVEGGQAIAFKRGAVEQSAMGFMRGYKVEQLAGMIGQKDREVIVSPSSLGSFEPCENDEFIALAGSQIGKVMAAEPIHMGDVLVRWNVRVRLN